MYNTLYVAPIDGSAAAELHIMECVLRKFPALYAELIILFVAVYSDVSWTLRVRRDLDVLTRSVSSVILRDDELSDVAHNLNEFFGGSGVRFSTKLIFGKE